MSTVRTLILHVVICRSSCHSSIKTNILVFAVRCIAEHLSNNIKSGIHLGIRCMDFI